MSHYTVLVVGDNPEEQLEPFSENLEVDAYKVYLDDTDLERMAEHYNLKITDTETLCQKMIDWNGTEGFIDEFGKIYYYSTYNPNSKWDWYSLGGRWTGYFKLKPSAISGKVGIPGVMGKPGPAGWVDQARKGDIDFEFMKQRAAQEAAEQYKEFKRITKGIECPQKPWREFYQDFEKIEDARSAWSAHPWIRALRSSNIAPLLECEFNYFCLEEKDPETAFIERAYRNAIATHSLLRDGIWHEKGKMGWFGVSYNEVDDWNDQFDQLLGEVTDDTLISIYDCHI